MLLPPFAALPCAMRNKAVLRHYKRLQGRGKTLAAKRCLDLLLALGLLAALLAPMLLIAAAICCESRGGALFLQRRVTGLGREFTIYKFRTMRRPNPGSGGPALTEANDRRVTRVGAVLRKTHLDELPQLLNILKGEMSFVGPRPELPQYVRRYTDEMRATLLLPAGLTSPASLAFCDEAQLLCRDSAAENEQLYLTEIMPRKAAMNLQYIDTLSLRTDAAVLWQTLRPGRRHTGTASANETFPTRQG